MGNEKDVSFIGRSGSKDLSFPEFKISSNVQPP